jgi:XTP/dITP diphosphohydrolase
MNRLLLGTGNKGKAKELIDLLGEVEADIISLSDVLPVAEPVESGSTFMENAQIKASYYSKINGCYTIADDSGLEVTSLNGAPGIFSARYAGISASSSENNTKLLAEIEKTNKKDRSARFVCVMCLADPNGNPIYFSEGICAGSIADKLYGINGFGYDPLFLPTGFSETFGKLPDSVKKSICHRALAV